MATGRLAVALGREHFERVAQHAASVGGFDDGIDEPALRRAVRDCGTLRRTRSRAVLLGRTRVGLDRAEVPAVEDLHRGRAAHDRDLGRRPGDAQVVADPAGVHHDVGAAVRLAHDDAERAARSPPQYACTSSAPCRIIPRHSRSRPGSKPGVSTNVRIGRLKASHHATNRAALRDASMSSVPARCWGWFATTPKGRPSSAAQRGHEVRGVLRPELEEGDRRRRRRG